MRNNIGFFLGVGALLGAALAPASAVEPTRQPAPEGSPSPAHAVSADVRSEVGKVLVLDNERTLTGDIERIDDQYRIKRLIGQTWIPAAKVMKLCASLEDAHAFLQSRANLADPDERMRLADWCRQHGLRDQALAEAQEALALRPQDSRAKRLVSYLLDAKARADAPPAAPAAEKPLPRIDVTAESLTVFAARVQPILMNACASCHTGGRGGAFQVMRTYSSGLANRKALEQNLAVVFAQVNTREPQMSRLLTKSVSIHGAGMIKAPLPGRQAKAYQVLEQWVLETLANNPQLREPLPAATAQASAGPVLMLPPPPTPARSSVWGDDRPSAGVPATTAAQATAPAPRAPVESGDPVDPEQFNRAFHPERPVPLPKP